MASFAGHFGTSDRLLPSIARSGESAWDIAQTPPVSVDCSRARLRTEHDLRRPPATPGFGFPRVPAEPSMPGFVFGEHQRAQTSSAEANDAKWFVGSASHHHRLRGEAFGR